MMRKKENLGFLGVEAGGYDTIYNLGEQEKQGAELGSRQVLRHNQE